MTSKRPNQNPEQRARDAIDQQLAAAGWLVQDKQAIDFNAGRGIAVREYQTDVGPADYVLFVDRKPIGVIEAKPEDWGVKITVVEEQPSAYAFAKLKWFTSMTPLPFVYESTGVITRFTDGRDPKPRSREVFSINRPETLADWLSQSASLCGRLQTLPPLIIAGLRECQIRAISNLEASFQLAKPRALAQMATGSGKTFTAISAVYRLLKHADAKRILFLVDTRNLGEQAEQEFMAFVPNDDNRKLTELYNVQRLTSGYIAKESQVCISTIQRMYALLKDQPLDEAAEETNPAEQLVERRERLTRRQRWEAQDDDETYSAKDLDRSVVNPDQIRTVITAYRDHLTRIFLGRQEGPKTLIFAKTDSHADDIIQIVREVFDEGNAFCKKVTYRAAQDRKDDKGKLIEKGEDPKSVLADFRNDYHPRIAVTVDMIATRTELV